MSVSTLSRPRVSSGGYAHGVEIRLSDNIEASLLMAFLMRAGIGAFVTGLVLGALSLLFDLVTGSTHGGLSTLVALGALAVFVILLIIPFREDLGEWQVTIDGRAGAADSAYAAIYGALRHRALPVLAATKRIDNELGGSRARNYLVIADGHYVTYVSVFGYGTGLFVGWTCWRRRSPILMFGEWFMQRLAALAGRGTLFHQMLRAETAKAFREAVHLSVQDGVDVAVENLSVPIAGTFGYDIPISSADDAPSAPTPLISDW